MNNFSLAWQLAWRYVRSQSRHTMSAFISKMSMLGLIIAVGLLLTVLSVMNGFEKEMRERILGLMPHITVYGYYADTDWDSVKDVLQTHPKIIAVAPYVRLQGLLIKGRTTKASMLLGVSPKEEAKASLVSNFVDAEIFQNLTAGEMILGKGLANKLKIKPGDSIVFMLPQADGNSDIPQIERFRVSAIFDSATELDQHLALISIEQAKQLNQLQAQALRVTTTDLFQVHAISSDILNSLPPDYVVSNWTETHGNLYAAILLSKRLLVFLMFIVMFVAIFNIVSSLVLLVKNKQSDIAILRTMGMTPKNILWCFIFLGALISVVGVVLGFVFGSVLALSLGSLLQFFEQLFSYHVLNSEVYPLDYLPSDIRGSDMLLIASVAIILSIISSLYPAWRAANIMPAKVLAKDKY